MRNCFVLILCLVSLGAFSGQPSAGIVKLQKQLDQTAQQKSYHAHIKTMIELSWAYFTDRSITSAETLGERALKAAELYGSVALTVSALNNLANIESTQGFFSNAEKRYRRAIFLDPSNTMLKLNLVDCLIKLGKTEESRALLQVLYQTAGSKLLTDKLILVSAEYSKQLGDYTLSRNFLEYALKSGDAHCSATAHLEMGKLLILMQNESEALTYLRQALLHSVNLSENSTHYKVYRYMAKILYRQKKVGAAVEAYRKAIEAAKDIRPYFSKSSNTEELRQISQTYYEFVELLLTQPDHNSHKTLTNVIRLMQELKISEVKNYFHDECAIEAERRKHALETVIEKDTALIYTVTLDDKVIVIVYSHGKYRYFSSDIRFEALSRAVIELRQRCQINSFNTLSSAQQLYKLLIKPCDATLEGISHLVLIPDSRLQQLPWGTLHDGKQFLIEKFSLSISSGMKMTKPEKLMVEDTTALTAGLTAGLAFVNSEIDTIHQLFPGQKLVDGKLTRATLEFQLRNYFYRIIHLATHADFSGSSDQSYIMTGEGKMNMGQLQDWIKMSDLREDGIELLTLSACKTAVGDDLNSLGLAGVAVRSGAASVLASLWQVDDKATTMLMTEFYNNLKNGDSKAAALQKAQHALISHNVYGSPYYWAPFILIGNWL